MKHFLAKIFSIFLFLPLAAQTPSDFYFKKQLPDGCGGMVKTPKAYIGNWQSKKDTLRSFVISENKIISQYKHLVFLSEKEFEKKGYEFKDGFVYGFTEKDSLPGVEINDTILFCYISEHLITNYDESMDVEIAEVKGGLLLSKKVDSVYSYTLITLDKGELVLKAVDHEPQLEKVLALTKAEMTNDEENNLSAYIADPDKKMMEKFISSGFFNDIQRCKREKEK